MGLASNNPILANITDYLIEEASAEEEELLALPEMPKKEKDPFAAVPKGNFDFDDFKRFYSNNDEEKSIPYFWEKVV